MDRYEITQELSKIISEYLARRGLELIELLYRREGRDQVLRVLADRLEGGISLGECAKLNRELGGLLDEKGILQEGYILEVSSPGLDRPLREKKDFLRCKDKSVKFFLKEPVEGKLEWDGLITAVDEDTVHINTADKQLIIPLNKINKAKQLLDNI
ncbi:MAG: ribosome maturation factor RimP [Candidatus Omnitrophica bacterium]|nr:ribosome maturation factor RimP [Candidatus Omnitrophota bacterium]